MTLEPKLTPEFAPYKRSWVVKAIPKGEEKPVYSKFAQGLTAGDAMAFMQAFVSALPSYTDTAKPFIGIVSIECDAEKRHDHDLPDLKFTVEVSDATTAQPSDCSKVNADNVTFDEGVDGKPSTLPEQLNENTKSILKSVKDDFAISDTEIKALHETVNGMKGAFNTAAKEISQIKALTATRSEIAELTKRIETLEKSKK